MKRKIFLILLLIFSFLVSCIQAEKYIQAKVIKVIDGDTIQVNLNKRIEKVRFIGVNCPESTTRLEPYGKEASNFTRKNLLNKTVYLELDIQTYDKYNRLLAYVWLATPNKITEQEIRKKMFNAILLLEGFAQIMTVPPNVKYVDYFVKFQREAREKQKGLWAPTKTLTTEKIIVYITRTGSKYHRAGCRYLRKSSIPITLKKAKSGGYTPCSVCNPPR